MDDGFGRTEAALNFSQNILPGVTLEQFEQEYLIARMCDYYMIKDRTADFIDGYHKEASFGDVNADKSFRFLSIINDSMVNPDVEYRIIEKLTKQNSSIWANLIGDKDYSLVSGIYYLNEYAKARGLEPTQLLQMYPREVIDDVYQEWLSGNNLGERSIGK